MFIQRLVYSSFIHNTPKAQTTCLSAAEWINNVWCTHTMEYYSVTRRDEVLPLAALQINLGNIGQRKTLATKDHMLYDSIYMKCPEEANPEVG